MDPKHYRDQSEKAVYEAFEKLTDRELEEKKALYLRNIEKYSLNIKNNVQFWFYATIICTALAIIIVASK